MVHYFSPGPSSLPTPVRNRVRSELLDAFDIGVSIMEISHRSTIYGELNAETHTLARKVFEVPETHEIIFTPFGAQQHFCLLIDHLSKPGDTVAYTDTGNWAHAAISEAERMGRKVAHVYDGKESAYRSLGEPLLWKVPREAKYLHLTVNNTVCGTEYAKIPDHFDVPLVLDMTSSIAARRDIPWSRTALIYASAQKNFGIAGVSVVIVRKDVLEQSRKLTQENALGTALSYPAFFDAKSIFNTPPAVAMFVANRMLQWIVSVGGTPTMEEWALERAAAIYAEMDSGFYKGRADKNCRSRHNFVFSLPEPKLDELFIAEAARQGILEIKGYRTTGGIRASMYNGVAREDGAIFAAFMREFKQVHG